MESFKPKSNIEDSESVPTSSPLAFLQQYLAAPVNPAAKWELSLRKRVTQALSGQRDATFLHGIRIALYEKDLSSDKEAILAALLDFELSRSAEYSKDDPRLNLKNLIRLALEVYINHAHLPVVHEVVSRHINSLSFGAIKEYLESGPKGSYGKERDKDLLLKLAEIRGKEIEGGERENEPAIQEVLNQKLKQEERLKSETEEILNQKNETEVIQKRAVEQVESEKDLKEAAERQEEEKRKVAERERNDQEIKTLQEKLDGITLLIPEETDNLFSYVSRGYEILFEPSYDSYNVGSVGVHTDIRDWNVFTLGDTRMSLNQISYHVDKYRTKKAKNKWETDYTNVDSLLTEELRDKWDFLKNKLYEELQLQTGSIAKLIEDPIRKRVAEKLNEIDVREDTERSSRYYGRNEEKSKAESKVAVLNKNIDYFAGIVNSGNTPREFTEPLQNILGWLETLTNEANHEIEAEQTRMAEESRKIEEQKRIEKIKETKFDFILEQIGAKATYLKELYELESGYKLGDLRGYGTRDGGANLGSVMSGASVGVTASANVGLSLRIEGPRDGIYIEMGDDLESAHKRLNMEDFVVPHEIGHLMARTLDNADEKILKHFQEEITQICEATEADSKESSEMQHYTSHHLKECVVDALGTRMALMYGVSDPFLEDHEARLFAHLQGFLSSVNVVLEQLELNEQEKQGYEYFLIRAMANIDSFRERIKALETEWNDEYMQHLEVLYTRASEMSLNLNQNINQKQREAILDLYRKTLDYASKLDLNELEDLK